MDYIEINEHLKNMINDLVDLGHKKTVIAKILLGTSGYAPIIKFLDNDVDTDLTLGVKPLTKVGSTINYDLRLVFVRKDDNVVVNGIQELNNQFFEELRQKIINYMNSDEYNTRKPYTLRSKRSNQFESILDEIFEQDILKEEDIKNNGTKLE